MVANMTRTALLGTAARLADYQSAPYPNSYTVHASPKYWAERAADDILEDVRKAANMLGRPTE